MISADSRLRMIQAYAAGIALLVMTSGSAAVTEQGVARAPHELVSEVVARVMARLGSEITPDNTTNAALLALFEQELSPHFAFATISRWIAGGHWAGFSAAEKAELEAVVHDHIVHVYASLLARGHSVEIRINPDSTLGAKSARVGGVLAIPGSRDVNLEFRLLRGDPDWKLYDLAVDGLSFARSLKAELQPVLDADGIEGLRAYLARHQ